MKEDNNKFEKIKDRVKIAKLMAEKNMIHIKYGSGNFFNAFADDAIIINYLFQYKIVSNNKAGFPRSAKDNLIDGIKRNIYLYQNGFISFQTYFNSMETYHGSYQFVSRVEIDRIFEKYDIN